MTLDPNSDDYINRFLKQKVRRLLNYALGTGIAIGGIGGFIIGRLL